MGCAGLSFAFMFLCVYKFLKRQIRRSGIPISFKGFGIVNKAEVDVFLELACFFDVPMNAKDKPAQPI